MYLTPAQFRAMDFGINVADLSDAQLASRLIAASADVDSYCSVPLTPQKHDFRGGTITGETHTWRMDPYDRVPYRRAFPYHTPLLELQLMRVHVTPDQYVSLDPSHVRYEPSEGWVEPFDAALTSYGLFGAGVLPFVGASQPWVELDYTYGFRERIQQYLYYGDDGWYSATRGYWVSTPTVRVNGNLASASDYTVDAAEGRIKFTSSAPADGDTVLVDVQSSLPYDIAEATGIIAASKLTDRAWAAKGFGGLRSVSVAEVRLERDTARNMSSSTRANVPTEAADKLEGYVFRTVR